MGFSCWTNQGCACYLMHSYRHLVSSNYQCRTISGNVCECVCVCVCVVCTRARVRAQSCPILWEPMDCRPPGSSVHGNFQAKILEWVAIFSYARESSGTRDRTASLVSPALAGGLYHCTIWAKGQIIFPLGFKVLEYYQKFSVHQDDKVNI